MSSATIKDNYNLLTWLTHIKHLHDIKKVVPLLSKPVPAKELLIAPVTTIQKKKKKKKNQERKKSITFHKDNLIRFHRPHGLFSKKQSKKQHLYGSMSSECSCCAQGCCSSTRLHRHSVSSLSLQDADDELDSEEDKVTIRSKDGTKLPPCMCSLENDAMSIMSDKTRTSRESSIHDLPAELDSPEVGFKKLQQDGDLVDYDDMGELTEHQFIENFIPKLQSYSRSAVRNSLIRLALNGPFQSPIETDNKKQILHVGCGNGDWCVDIATLFPNWLVVGMDDKSGGPIQDSRKVPKNFKFIRCYYDILKTLKDVPSCSFDLVYCRFLLFTYGKEKYNELIKEAHRICKPGGYVEFYELDMRIYGNPKAGPMTHQLNSKVFKSMEQHNLDPRLARKLGDMVSAQFNRPDQEPLKSDSISTKNFKKEHFNTNYTSLPLGVWGGKLGVMFRDDINDLFENFELYQQTFCPLHQNESDVEDNQNIPKPEEIEAMDEEMNSQKSFMNLHHVYAQKNTNKA